MDSDVVGAFSLAFSLVAVAVSSFIAVRQTKIMRDANLMPVLTDIFKDFSSLSFKGHLSYIQHELWQDTPPDDNGTSDLSAEARAHFYPVFQLFTTVGVLVANNVISKIVPASMMGGSILRAWSRMAPYLSNERRKRNDPNYGMFFENLAASCLELPPPRLEKRLSLRRMPPTWSFAGWEGQEPSTVAALFSPARSKITEDPVHNRRDQNRAEE